MTPDALRRRFDAALGPPLDVPPPGTGHTARRFAALWSVGADDLSLARLVEAHTDAVAILREAGRDPIPGARYAVWASEAPDCRVRASPVVDGWRLAGTKRFCSGLGHVSHALITADAPDGSRLFEVPLDLHGDRVGVDSSGWQTEAFASTQTGTLRLDHLELAGSAAVGAPGWYVSRAGFWHGAIGVAACWAGGAAAIVAAHDELDLAGAHRAAHAGAMRADVWEMRGVLEHAAREIDADPADHARAGMARALAARFVIERAASDVLRRFGASAGPAPLAFDAGIARRCAELQMYMLQSHAERDLESLGRADGGPLTARPAHPHPFAPAPRGTSP